MVLMIITTASKGRRRVWYTYCEEILEESKETFYPADPSHKV